MATVHQTQKRCLLFGISLLSFIAFLDATIVSTALPAIQLQLSISLTQLQWIMNAFYLGCSALMASMGRIADIYGRRKVFYLGVLVFGFASIGAGLAQSASFLIFCRAVQGMMIAIIIPVGIALIQVSHEQNEIPKAMGVFGMVTGLGLALGPVVGGALVTAFGWPAIFFVNIPFIFIGFIFCFKTVKESRVSAEIRLDYGGVFFLTLTIFSLVFGIVEGNNYGWHSPFIQGSLLLFIISLFFLILIERRVKYPILAGYLFHNKIFVTTMVFAFLGGGMMGVILFIDPLYLQVVLGFNDFITGIYLFVISAVVMFGAYLVGHLNHHYGAKIMLIFGTLFYLVSIMLHMNFTVQYHPLLVLSAFIFMGLGWAIVNVVPSAALGTNIYGDHLAVAFGALFTFYNVASSLMLALSVSLFHSKVLASLNQVFVQKNLNLQIAAISQGFASQPDKLKVLLPQLPAAINPSVAENIFRQAFVSGVHRMFLPLIIVGLISLFVILFMKTARKS